MTTHRVRSAHDTIMAGLIDPHAAPVCEVEPGDTLLFDTWTMWGNASQPGLTLEGALRLRDRCRAEGRGPHCLTGPIAVKGARPGDVLRVDIRRLEIAGHGVNVIFPGNQSRGLLADMFPRAELRHFQLDRRTMTTSLGSATIPLRPFLGIMGVLPDGDKPLHSAAPGVFGGNIDCPDIGVGTTLYLPVFVEGAGFYAGDAHAAQGCGEVDQTALETAMTEAEVKLSLVDRAPIKRPRAETSDHLITMGFSEDLREAARQALEDMIDLLVEARNMGRSEAYALCSLQADLIVTQVVNGVNGIHVKLPKRIFQDPVASA